MICDNSHTGNFHNYAGGIYCESSNPVIEGNYIANNRSGNVGGGLCLIDCDGLITANTITGNRSHYGGAMSCGVNSNPTISFNIIFDNDADAGDGLDIFDNSTPLIVNNVIADNYPLGILCDKAYPTITNSIVWGNSILGCGAGSVVTYCDIQGGFEGTGNIDTDPLFRDPENGDFHLMTTTAATYLIRLVSMPGIRTTPIWCWIASGGKAQRWPIWEHMAAMPGCLPMSTISSSSR